MQNENLHGKREYIISSYIYRFLILFALKYVLTQMVVATWKPILSIFCVILVVALIYVYVNFII